MGEQGGLRTGWIAAFGTEGYDGEPPLLEELGVNFGHIKGKVRDNFRKGKQRRVFESYGSLELCGPSLSGMVGSI